MSIETDDDVLAKAWPKEFSELKDLEKLLRCNICKEFMKTSLITGCSHLFCSYCIRQSIQYRNQCPACFVELYDNQLRPERTLDEVIRIFTSVKSKLLKRLRISYAACPSDDNNDEGDSNQTKKKDVSTFNNTNHTDVPSEPAKVILFNSPIKPGSSFTNKTPTVTRTVPSIFSPSLTKSKISPAIGNTSSEAGESGGPTVPCPVCNVEIPQRNINLHLDECLARANGAPPKSQPMNRLSRKPLPKLVLNLLKEKELKQYCKEYGLSTVGDRKTLTTRIQRYTVLYNSECDNLNPRSKQEIARQVEKEEKNISSNHSSVKTLFSQINKKSDPKVIEEANAKYLEANKDSFTKLIQNMKQRSNPVVRTPRPTVHRILSDDEDEDDPQALIPASKPEVKSNDEKTNKNSCENQISVDKSKTNAMSTSSSKFRDFFQKTPQKKIDNEKIIPLSPHVHIITPEYEMDSPIHKRSSHNLISNTSPNLFSTMSKPTLNSSCSLDTSTSKPQSSITMDNLSSPVSNSSSCSSDYFETEKVEAVKKNICGDKTGGTSSGGSPELFLDDNFDNENEEEPDSNNQCLSPRLLAGHSVQTPKSQSNSHITDNPFISSDDELNFSLGQSNHTITKPLSTPPHSLQPCGGNSEDSGDDNFLQLVQNKKGKRKSKDLYFSPRATRSKKTKNK